MSRGLAVRWSSSCQQPAGPPWQPQLCPAPPCLVGTAALLRPGTASEVSTDIKYINKIKNDGALHGCLQTGVTCSHLRRVAPNPGDHCCDRFLKAGPSHLLVVKLHDVAINYSCYLVLALTDVPLSLYSNYQLAASRLHTLIVALI